MSTASRLEGDRHLHRVAAVAYRHRHSLLLGWLVLLWWATFYRLGALRYERYWSFGFDLGLFDQAIWLTAHLKNPFMTLRGLDVWGHHGNFVFVLFAPFYWIGAGARFLLAAQLLSQAAGALGIYLLTRDLVKQGRWLGIGLAASMLLHPSMQFLAWEYFHPETFAIGPIVLAYWALRTDRMRWFWALAVLSMACKEDITLVFLMLGLLLIAKRRFRLGGYLAGIAALWYVSVTKILIPLRNPAGPFYEGHFFSEYGGSVGGVLKTIVRHPSRVWRDLTEENRLTWYLRVWFPVAFVPFLAADVLLLLLPMLAVVVLAGVSWVQDYRYHYVAVPLAITFLATVEAVARLRVPWRRHLVVSVIVATSLLSSLRWGVGPGTHNYRRGYWPVAPSESYLDVLAGTLGPASAWPVTEAKKRAVALVPESASVSAAFNVNPHLAHRTHVYEWPNPWIGTNWGICNVDNLHDPATVQWLVIDRSYLEGDPAQEALLDRLLREEFEIRLEESGVVAAERVRPPLTARTPSPRGCLTLP